jgi:predicted Zn-dependent protease with MMP-like domain
MGWPGSVELFPKNGEGVNRIELWPFAEKTGFPMMRLSRKEFEEAVVSGLKMLPGFFRAKMENVDVVIEEQASQDVLSEMEIRSPFELLGLYQGIPLSQRGFYYGNVLPDKITLFQRPIESMCRTKKEVEEKVREVVIHEIGHYFGLDDERLEELEEEAGE